jgi:hypothetical protein
MPHSVNYARLATHRFVPETKVSPEKDVAPSLGADGRDAGLSQKMADELAAMKIDLLEDADTSRGTRTSARSTHMAEIRNARVCTKTQPYATRKERMKANSKSQMGGDRLPGSCVGKVASQQTRSAIAESNVARVEEREMSTVSGRMPECGPKRGRAAHSSSSTTSGGRKAVCSHKAAALKCSTQTFEKHSRRRRANGGQLGDDDVKEATGDDGAVAVANSGFGAIGLDIQCSVRDNDSSEDKESDVLLVAACVDASRSACKLRYLNGAAPVCYGIPTAFLTLVRPS